MVADFINETESTQIGLQNVKTVENPPTKQ